LDSTRHVAKNPLVQNVCGEGPPKNVILKILIQPAVFKNDRHIATSIIYKKDYKSSYSLIFKGVACKKPDIISSNFVPVFVGSILSAFSISFRH
jgi:hypothetical protein